MLPLVIAGIAAAAFFLEGCDSNQGLKGNTGPQGSKGEEGPKGPQGPEGPAGQTGPKGTNGYQGPTGPQGVIGATGPQGPGINWNSCKLVYKNFTGNNGAAGELDCGANKVAINGGCGYWNVGGDTIGWFREGPCNSLIKAFIVPGQKCFGGVSDDEASLRGRYCDIGVSNAPNVSITIYTMCCDKN